MFLQSTPLAERSAETLEDLSKSRAPVFRKSYLPGIGFAATEVSFMPEPAASVSLLEACWRNLVLGIVQGLTEFLPISSTAHLKVVPVLLGWGDPGVSVTAAIQLGSIAAVIAYFRSDLFQMLKGIGRALRHGQWRAPQARLGIAIVVGTAPILMVGLLIKLFWSQGYEESLLRSIPLIAVISIAMALLMALAERLGPRVKKLADVSGRDGLIVGFAQALALIPGVSRSGSTLTASLFAGWQRADAARFSFLLGVPAISFAGLVELNQAFLVSADAGPLPLLTGIVSAAVVSWLTIDWLLKFFQRHSTWIFVAYRLMFGAALLAWWSLDISN